MMIPASSHQPFLNDSPVFYIYWLVSITCLFEMSLGYHLLRPLMFNSQLDRRSHSRGSTGAWPSHCGGLHRGLEAAQSWRDASFRVWGQRPGSGLADRPCSLSPCTSGQPVWGSISLLFGVSIRQLHRGSSWASSIVGLEGSERK